MRSLKCKVCFARWDSDYVRTEMAQWESKLFLAGKGCPCCQGHNPESWNYDAGMRLAKPENSNV